MLEMQISTFELTNSPDLLNGRQSFIFPEKHLQEKSLDPIQNTI